MKKIILAIDDDLTRSLYRDILKVGGFNVFDCDKENILFEALQEFNADLLLLDLSLENNKGWEIFQKVKKDYPNLPVFLLANFEVDEYKEKAKKEGATDFLVISLTPPKELLLKVKLFFKEVRSYQIEININSPELKLWAEDLGFLPNFKCQKCLVPLQLLLIQDSVRSKNYFKVIMICPKCKDIYFEKED
ncbi:response regulator [Candidatus Parcubacteria bacterium]|nr:response regulator [Candidatus Parcubacteria bacterium]